MLTFPSLDAVPGTTACPPELEQAFVELQERLPAIWQSATDDPFAEQTVVVVPSLSMDVEELRKLRGVVHYEERMLFLLILLRMPRTRVVFVTSEPIHPSIIDYYLQLLPGIPFSHARSRLHMFAAHDSSIRPLTEKILERPTLIRRIQDCLGDTSNTHLTCFNVTPLERRLSVALGVPLFGPLPRHVTYGQKSGARKLFRSLGLTQAPGFEDLRDEIDIVNAIADLHRLHPRLRRVVIKINDGFSGDGNAIYPLSALREASQENLLSPGSARAIVHRTLAEQCSFPAAGLTWDRYLEKFGQMQGVVEGFIEGRHKASPSAQVRLTPLREVELISTHDQILGGADGQVFVGCRFPARRPYRLLLHDQARRIGAALVADGVMSRLSIDFITVRRADGTWRVYPVEINLRKGGTTHPYRTLQLLTAGSYYAERGLFVTGSGDVKYYVASDNLESERYRGLLPEDLLDITTFTRLHYKSSTNTGVVFHMIGALSEFGKVGVTCIGDSARDAQSLYDRTVAKLDEACQTTDWMVRAHKR